jgi:hypothetical protein
MSDEWIARIVPTEQLQVSDYFVIKLGHKWFEWLEWSFVLGGLQVLAIKTGNPVVWVIYVLSYCIMFGYFNSYSNRFEWRLAKKTHSPKIARLINLLPSSIILGITYGTVNAVSQIFGKG